MSEQIAQECVFSKVKCPVMLSLAHGLDLSLLGLYIWEFTVWLLVVF